MSDIRVVYVVLFEDRHTGAGVQGIFADKDDAIECATEYAEDSVNGNHDVVEEEVEDCILCLNYAGEETGRVSVYEEEVQ